MEILRVHVSFIHLFRPNQGAVVKNATIGPLAGNEPAVLRFRCAQRSNQLKADFHCCVFHTHVCARKTLNPFKCYL
jgi:hypothetical protein